jgi:MFS family permease
MNLGIGLGGVTGGLIATTSDPGSFTILFLLDAATFLVFVAVLPFVPEPRPQPAERAARDARYAQVFRDRVFLGLIALNVVFVAAGYTQLGVLLPAFAKNHSHVSETAIGLIFWVNTIVIVVAQLPLAKALEGRRRMPALALMSVLFGLSWVIVLLGGLWLTAAAAAVVFALAATVFAVGECLQGPTHQALIADLAPPELSGRYFSVHSMSWGLGGVIGPAVGGFILGAAPLALWPAMAAACAAAGAAALMLEHAIPTPFRRTPAAAALPATAAPEPQAAVAS